MESQSYYPDLFSDAFDDSVVTTDRIARALAQFVRSLVSFTSPYDEGRSQVNSPLLDFPNFTDQENLGKESFMRSTNGQTVNCAGCHNIEAFINSPAPDPVFSSARNNGLDAESIDDLGVRESTGLRRDTGQFRSLSLCNIAIRLPYMHDGRFATLEEVVDFYSEGIQDHPQLANSLRDASPCNSTSVRASGLLSLLL